MPRFTLQTVLDRTEQVVVLVLYSALIARVWPEAWSGVGLTGVLLIISEGVVVFFLLIRRPTQDISVRPVDWAVAAGGTISALLVSRGGAPLAVEAAVILMLLGKLAHVGAKISLNRSFGLVAANRGVKTFGLYRFIRHPMYAGYIIAHVGFLLANPSMRNVLVYIVCWTLFVFRIRFEERILLQDPQYQEFAQRVRWRLIPGVF